MHEITVDWEKQWAERIKEIKRISGTDYWNKRAEDYNDYIRTSRYEHGKKIKEIFEREGILKPDFEVLDIAAGPGSATIPFAESVRKVVAVEPAEEMCKKLISNSHEAGCKNIEIINSKWEKINTAVYEHRFDLVVCSHALWHFPDIVEQLNRMNRVSKAYCCIAESAGGYGTACDMYKTLGIDSQDFDYFIHIYNILYRENIAANVRIIDTVMRRSVYSGVRMWELVLGKYRKPTEKDREIIREYVLRNSEDDVYERKGKMAVIWWQN